MVVPLSGCVSRFCSEFSKTRDIVSLFKELKHVCLNSRNVFAGLQWLLWQIYRRETENCDGDSLKLGGGRRIG